MLIRSGTARDLADAGDLWEEAQAVRRGIPPTEPSMFGTIAKPLASVVFLVVEERGAIVGTAVASQARTLSGTGEPIEGLAHINYVATKPSHWGRGFGRRLMTALLEEISLRGYRAAQLWTQRSNERALELYLDLGFTFADDEKEEQGERIRRYHIDLAGMRE